MVRLKASSLIEATLALSILTVVMSVAWICIEQVLHNTDQAQKLHATILLQQYSHHVEDQQLFYNTTWDSMGYHIEQQIEKIDNCSSCYLLKLKCITPSNIELNQEYILSEQ